ncbi:MAG: hypothetical protein SF052_24290 [Bacteroidia bacterium]|nr:hypothetical protein [Bacteroidia bacterium]
MHFFRRIFLLLLIFPEAVVLGQVSADTLLARRLYPYTFFHTDYLKSLETGWTVGGRSEQIPFSFPLEDARFFCRFSMPECLPEEDLYLYFEGFAWEGEVILNGHYLGFFPKPFEPHSIKIDSSWLQTENNFLQLNMSTGQFYELYPRQFLGVFRPAYFLTASQLASIKKRAMPEVLSADTVAVVAPYFRTSQGYHFEEFPAAENLQPLKKMGIRHLYFPFEPDRKFEAFCAQAGFIRVRNIKDDSRICVVNAWPWEPATYPWKFLPWLDIKGNRTVDYGELFPVKGYTPSVFVGKNRFALSILVLMPFIFLFLIKLASPGFFYSLPGMFFKPKLHIDFSMEAGGAQQGLLLLLHTFRIASMSAVLALGIYIADLHHGWKFLNLIREPSLMHQLFYESRSFPLILVKSIAAVLGWFVLKHILIILIGRIFKIKGMFDGLLNLEIVGTFPVILLMPLPLVAFLIAEGPNLRYMGVILGVLLLIYYLRRLYVLFVGLNRLFEFSSGMKILYICTFNIFAYLIWL